MPREAEEIDESGAGRRPRLALATVRIVGRRCRVHEPEQRRWIKDAAPSRLGPLSLDEAEQLRFVDVGEASRLRVQQAEPRDTRSNRKGLPTKPPANGRGQIAARHFCAGVMDGVRGAERRERARHRPAHPSASLRVGIVCRRPVMTRQEGLHALQLLQDRSRLTQGRELPREIERHIHGRAGQTTATALTTCVTRACVPAVRERGESIEPAEVARLGQRPIERAYRLLRQVEGRGFEREVRRAEEAHQRRPGEARGDRVEHQVQGGSERLGGQGQGVERLEGNARASEHRAGQIEIRQRPAHDQRLSRQRGRSAGSPGGLEAASH